jgi:LacI family transcriptional regulator
MKKVSLKDIAALVGVAPSTVSFVLNGKAREMRISESLASKIIAIAQKAGYHPNQVAVSLRTGSSRILGLIIEDISNNFFASLAKTIELEAKQFGYNVVLCSTENDTDKARQLLRILNQHQVDGYLVTPTVGMCEELRSFSKGDHPMVLMDRTFPDLNLPCVLADNFRGVTDGMEHLIEQGYKEIAFVTVDMDLVQMHDRERAYWETFQRHGIKAKKSLILKLAVNTPRERAVEIIAAFLQKNPSIKAIFFATNYLGIAGLESIRSLSLEIPGNLAVVCFDDHDIFRMFNPGITCICQPIEEIGKNAVHLLIDRINGIKKSKINMNQHAAKLIIRPSTQQK